ncbi:MAG: serine/threonine-protein phosphatase, partial [Lachnospiraceae bacterium]|nr:serine/threonine-protein phosphatase [Lachnospiraceae bacterium]
YVANVGDSRLYVVNGDICQVSRDHSLVEELVAKGELERGSQDYYEQKNIITRAVGIKGKVRADFFEVELQRGDVILLCSDGLTNMVSDERIARIIETSASLSTMAHVLVDEANKNGGKDNISVVLIKPEIETR